jgi:hypothetical protein
MLRPFIIGILACGIPVLADFACPDGTTPLERKDEAQWMKACLDTDNKLQGPFEIWSHPAESEADQEYHRTTKGQYTHGTQTGTWVFWDIHGGKKEEKTFP